MRLLSGCAMATTNAIREYISRFTQICFLARMAQRESLYEGLEYYKI